MENKLIFTFKDQNERFELDITQPDLAKLVQLVIEKNLLVSKENISLATVNQEFDVEEFLDIFISVHEEFKVEIDKFYENISKDIKTYYSNETLSDEIISRIKNDTSKLTSDIS